LRRSSVFGRDDVSGDLVLTFVSFRVLDYSPAFAGKKAETSAARIRSPRILMSAAAAITGYEVLNGLFHNWYNITNLEED
jgi:hypothetical protein